MRSLNNWVKTALIDEAIESLAAKSIPIRVIDFGCGKGGDLDKWVRGSQGELESYVGIDIARGSLEDFAGRVAAMAKINPSIKTKVIILSFII